MAGARWLRQRSNARKCEFAMKALTVWRAVPPCCHAVLAQSMRAQHASNTTARANYHTHLPSFKRPAITFGRTSGWRRRRWNQSSEGRVGRVFKLGERSPLMCPPWATTPSAAINQAWQHGKRRWQHAVGDHEITPSSVKVQVPSVHSSVGAGSRAEVSSRRLGVGSRSAVTLGAIVLYSKLP